jgi:hypothetical protein
MQGRQKEFEKPMHTLAHRNKFKIIAMYTLFSKLHNTKPIIGCKNN